MKKLLTCAFATLFTLSVVGCKDEPKPNPPAKADATKTPEKPKDAAH